MKKYVMGLFFNYSLFSEIELNYLVTQNIMSGSINGLAYYNSINNGGDFLTDFVGKKRT